MAKPAGSWALASLLLASLLGPASGPASADGVLILGALPPFDPVMNESENLTLTVYLSVSQPVLIQWSVDGVPQNASGTAFTYRPDYRSAGDRNVSCAVSSADQADSHSWTVHVADRDEPLALLGWEPAGDAVLPAGSSLGLSLELSNPDGDPLTIQWFIDGALVARPPSPAFDFTAGPDLHGAFRVTARVSDGRSEILREWNLTVERVLVVSPEGAVRLAEGSSQTFRAEVPEGTVLTWTLDGHALGETSRNFTFRPGLSDSGAHRLTVAAPGNLSHGWDIVVTNFNQPPVLPEGRLIEATVGEPTPVRVKAHDPDGRIVSYEWDFDSDGVFDQNSKSSPNLTRTFTRAGEQKAVLRVTDNEGASASTIFIFDVKQKRTTVNWWVPAGALGPVVLVALALVLIQRRHLSKLRSEMQREAFFTSERRPGLRELPAGAGTGALEEPPPGEEPPGIQEAEEEPELLEVKRSMTDRRLDLEVSPEEVTTDMVVRRKRGPAAPEVPAPEKGEVPEEFAGSLRDEGAESEHGAADTEISAGPRRKPAPQLSPEPSPALRDRRAEGEARPEDVRGAPDQKKRRK